MSLVHLELYESRKLDTLDFSSYLRKLIYDLIRLYRNENCNIQVNLNVNSFFLGVDTAVSLGIIINKLFTNSFKYAFPAGTGGEINISLSKERDKEEDGNQLSSDVYSPGPRLKISQGDSGRREHFTLVDQIEGDIELERAGAQNLFSNSWVKSNAAAERVLQGIGKNQKEVD